jgi:hypothetical protein
MPTLSLYAFDRSAPDQAGHFWQSHITHAAGGWAWDDIYNLDGSHAMLAWERQDNEDVIDLSGDANTAVALSQIDALFSDPVSRSGPIRTSYVKWSDVPSEVHDPNPGLHQPWELLAELHIDFHVSTPWYCSDADGTITYYVFFSLDGAGNLSAEVQGWYYHYDGGGPFCTGDISSGLDGAIPGGVGTLQGLLTTAINLFAARRTFVMIYFLPGHGDRMGFSEDDADNNVSLAALPN